MRRIVVNYDVEDLLLQSSSFSFMAIILTFYSLKILPSCQLPLEKASAYFVVSRLEFNKLLHGAEFAPSYQPK